MSRTPDTMSLLDFTLRAAGMVGPAPPALVIQEWLDAERAAKALEALPAGKRLAMVRDFADVMGRLDAWRLNCNCGALASIMLSRIDSVDAATMRIVLTCLTRFHGFQHEFRHKQLLNGLEKLPKGALQDVECRALLDQAWEAIQSSRYLTGAVDQVEAFARYRALFGAADAQDARAHCARALLADAVHVEIAQESADERALLDAWIVAWTRRMDELRAGVFTRQPQGGALSALGARLGLGVSNFEKARRGAQAIVEAAIPRAKAVGYELRDAMDEHSFRRIRAYVDHPGVRHFDAAWLADLREAAQTWRNLGPQLAWAGERVPCSAAFAAIETGDGKTLADLLWSQRQSKPPAKWRQQVARLARGETADAACEALQTFLRAVASGSSSATRAQLWSRVDQYQNFRAYVKTQEQVFGDVAAATCVQLFDYFAPYIIFSDGSGNFGGRKADPSHLSDAAVTLARSAVHALSAWPCAETVAVLRDVAVSTLAKTQQGYRSLIVANAAITALGEIATPQAVTALGAIKLKVRDERLVKQIAAAMTTASVKAGMSVEELEEVSAPTFDLDEIGLARVMLADHTATLTIRTTRDVVIAIARGDGKPVKSVPASVKADAEASAALKALKARQKEIEQALPVHARRLEASWFSNRATPYAQWRERTLDHVFVGALARRLIWRLEIGDESLAAFSIDGRLVDSQGAPITRDLSAAQVRLWHPLDASEDEIARWRAFIVSRRIVQPFKQAHRELYPLTDAERATATYSNRFAGHILRQHQSVALARLKGWRATLRISADRPNDEPTHRKIPDYNLAVEYWTSHAGGDDAEFTDGLAYIFLQTDRVRFRRLDGELDAHGLGAEVRLEDVPPRIFSEAMRDVDLFVGVASVANDPTWADGGAASEHPSQWRRTAATDYWNARANAHLDVTAKARRDFLQQLLPSLAIGPRCAFDDKHLVVQGKRHAYRIHLGSGNILMENERYLCIVPKAADLDEVFLPFEGDRMTSIVLSKALMLAADDKIRDKTILRQL